MLIVDEAHNLDWEVLEEIRLLGNLENRAGSCCRSSWPGSRNSTASWRGPNTGSSNSGSHCAAPYAGWICRKPSTTSIRACRVPGWIIRRFPSTELMEEIHFRTQGIPRLINGICDNLLLTAFAMESKVGTLAMLDEVTADMRLEYAEERPFRSRGSMVQAGFGHRQV